MQIEKGKLDVEALSRNKNEPEWLKNIRINAINRFNELNMPFLRYGLYAITKLDKVNLDSIDIFKEGNIEVIGNKELLVEDLHSALIKYEEIIKKYITSLVQAEDKFSALNLAAFNKGLFIYADKNLIVKEPIEINMNTNLAYVLIVAEQFSNINLIFNNKDYKGEFKSEIIEIIAKENSNINIVNIQNLNLDVNNFSIKKAFVDRDANVDWYDFNFGGNLTKSEITSFLAGNGAGSKNYSLFLGNSGQFFDFNSRMLHYSENTRSEMFNKGVLNDKAKAIYNGLIHIKKNARRSNGYQKFDALLLSKDSGVDPIPKLEIDNDDVKCSHGATITYADKEKLFYLMSRGLNEEEARKELVLGFIESFIDKVKIDNKEKIKELVLAKVK